MTEIIPHVHLRRARVLNASAAEGLHEAEGVTGHDVEDRGAGTGLRTRLAGEGRGLDVRAHASAIHVDLIARELGGEVAGGVLTDVLPRATSGGAVVGEVGEGVVGADGRGQREEGVGVLHFCCCDSVKDCWMLCFCRMKKRVEDWN